jgi:hypothetical protein
MAIPTTSRILHNNLRFFMAHSISFTDAGKYDIYIGTTEQFAGRD